MSVTYTYYGCKRKIYFNNDVYYYKIYTVKTWVKFSVGKKNPNIQGWPKYLGKTLDVTEY